jgi:tetratricopeptide (TPR) repeat protein
MKKGQGIRLPDHEVQVSVQGNLRKNCRQATRSPAPRGILALLEPTRIEILQQLIAQNPASSFARYGLAMEYVKSGDLESGAREFAAILATDPNYSAAYFHGGQTLEKLGRLEDARDYYRRGIAVTRDPHARAELQGSLDILGE